MRKYFLLPVLCLLCLLFVRPAHVSAATERYTNPETGYEARVIDELGLLSENERQNLLSDYMKPITRYANVVFWTTNMKTSDEVDQARLKRREQFGLTNATIFAINLNVRKLTIQSYGVDDIITKSRANSITNNVRNYATRGDYYQAASKAFNQINSLLDGNRIAEPMKVMSNICLALMAGLLLMFRFVRKSVSTFTRPSSSEVLRRGMAPLVIREVRVTREEDLREYSPPTRESSCSSCSSSSCSSCSSSSCSSCGSGGSSSF